MPNLIRESCCHVDYWPLLIIVPSGAQNTWALCNNIYMNEAVERFAKTDQVPFLYLRLIAPLLINRQPYETSIGSYPENNEQKALDAEHQSRIS